MSQLPLQATVITQEAPFTNQALIQMALFNEAGEPLAQPTQMAAQADIAALTQAAITGGESPTEAEFNALLADHAATRTAVNSLLAKLRTAGLLAEA